MSTDEGLGASPLRPRVQVSTDEGLGGASPLRVVFEDSKGGLSLVSNFLTAGVSSSVRKLQSVTLEASHPEGPAA